MEKYIDWYCLAGAGLYLGLATCAIWLGMCAKREIDPSDSKLHKNVCKGLFWVCLGGAIGGIGLGGFSGWKAYDTARYQQKYSVVLNNTEKYTACNGQEMTTFYGKGDGKTWQLSAPYSKDLRANRGDTLDVLVYTDRKGRIYCEPDFVIANVRKKNQKSL
jgi:hypothetical protein